MKNSLKYILLFTFIIVVLCLTGCGKLNIVAKITEDNKVTYSYEMTFDIKADNINYSALNTYLIKLKKHWQEEGFEVEITETTDGIRIISIMENEFETRQEAFNYLYECMTNKVSPFTDVEYAYNLNYYYEDYFINSHIDLSNLVNEDIYTAYPDIVGEDVDSFTDNFKVNVTFKLPKNESNETDIIFENEISIDAPYNEITEIKIDGVINNNAHVKYEKNLLAKKEKEKKTLIILSIIVILALSGMIVLLVLKKKMVKEKDEKTKETTDEIIDENENTEDTDDKNLSIEE